MSSTIASPPSQATTHERATSTTINAPLAAPPQQTPPTLRTIPPELRNRIYAYTLVQEQPIELSTGSSKNTSALLRTCRQIRQEASPMFYTANEFTFKIHGYRGLEAAPALKVHLQFSRVGRENFQLEICRKCRESIHLEDFAKWLRAYHRDANTVPRLEPRLCVTGPLWGSAVRRIVSTIDNGGVPGVDTLAAITFLLAVLKVNKTALPFRGCSMLTATEDVGTEKREGCEVWRG